MTGRSPAARRPCFSRELLVAGMLLLLAFLFFANGIASAVRGLQLSELVPIVLTGLAVGWLLALTRLPGMLSLLLTISTGVILVALRIGQLEGPLLSLLREAVALGLRAVQLGPAKQAASLVAAWNELSGGVTALTSHLFEGVQVLLRGGQSADPVFLGTIWLFVSWLCSAWGSWSVRRGSVLVGLAPGATVLAVVQGLAGGRTYPLLVFLFALLVLLAWLAYHDLRRHWVREDVPYVRRTRSNVTWLALGLSLTLVTGAALVPSVSLAQLGSYAGELLRDEDDKDAAESLGLESRAASATTEQTLLLRSRAGGLPRRHLIGSGPELSEQVAMYVSLERQPAGAEGHSWYEAPSWMETGPYWKSVTYDRYTGRGWSTSGVWLVDLQEGVSTGIDPGATSEILRQDVQLSTDRAGLLYSAGSLVAADRDYQVAWREIPDGQTSGDMFGARVAARRYRVDSSVSAASASALRQAGQMYPDWVVQRYLSLPDVVPNRVHVVARELTATEPTPYDRALAIQDHLRRIPYTTDLPAPPMDREIADYFLFDLQRGYCDYYATAMVVLCRAAGLPSRLAVGYATGAFHASEGHYVVTEDQAHAWPEVYFPGHGWIEFEPTAGRPLLGRPASAPSPPASDGRQELEPITAHRRRVDGRLFLFTAGGVTLLVSGLVLAWSALDTWRLGRAEPAQAVIQLYRRIYGFGRCVGVLASKGNTVTEYSASLSRQLSILAENSRLGAALRSAPEEIRRLAELCTRALYSSQAVTSGDRNMALHTWRRLRSRLWLARLWCLAPLPARTE